MRVLKNVSCLFVHAHLLLDGMREYLDGALAVKDGRIEAVFPQSDPCWGEWSSFRVIDVHHAVLQPGYVAPCLQRREILSENDLLAKGITSYFAVHEKGEPLDYAAKEACVGIYVREEYSLAELQEMMAAFPKICACISSEKKKRYVSRNGLVFLPANSFDVLNNPDLLSIMAVEDKIKCFRLDKTKETELSLLKKTSSRFSLWANPNEEGYKDLALLKAWGYRERDLQGLSGHNVLSFFAKQQDRGELLRGKRADLVCIDAARRLKFVMQGGDLYL